VITHFSGVSPWRIDVLLNAYLRTGSERSVTIEHFPHNEHRACVPVKGSENNSEWLTRKRLIDPKLKAAGWHIVPFDPGAPLTYYDCCAVEEFETEHGPV
jgi:hypothetical protein